jgi:REP element-mobilizing transposase RayT
MKYNPEMHHRRSIRLKDYDYSQTGAYFVTICTQNKEYLFGNVINGEMSLNDAGRIVASAWNDLPGHNDNILLDVFSIMPNHFHGIILIVGAGSKPALVSADNTYQTVENRAGSKPAFVSADNTYQTVENRVGSKPALVSADNTYQTVENRVGLEPAPTNPTMMKQTGLPEIVRQFKTFSARRINRIRNMSGVPVWQRNYYEHIIRNEPEINKIREYIANNPLNWEIDENYR